MTRCVLEISDSALAVFDAGGLRTSSPAIAVGEGDRIEVGEAARQRARLNPSRSHDRFWAQLDQQPLPRALGSARSHADLAWFHLRELWQVAGRADDEVVVAVPPDWDRQQLALMLGIAKASEVPVVGLVAAPVAAAAVAGDGDARGDTLYLDAQVQRLRLTRIEAGDALALGGSFEAARRGLAGLYDRWAGVIAERFLHETRFDPLHRAPSEQALYERLPEWLARLAEQPSAGLQLQVEQRQYRIEITRHSLIEAVREDYDAVAAAARAHAGGTLLASHRIARLPGLTEHLQAAAFTVVELPAAAVAQGALEHFERIRSDPAAPLFVTRLPPSRPRAAPAVAEPAVAAPTLAPTLAPTSPTHVLLGWRASPLSAPVPLADVGVLQRVAAGDHVRLRLRAGATVQVNGQPVADDTPVWAGDRIEWGGATAAVLIVVE